MIRIKRPLRFAGILLLASQSLSCASKPSTKPAAAPRPATNTKREYGIASVYTDRRTASGERFSASAHTAAHRTLPFGTLVRVTAPRTGRSIIVRINDRGPFIRGRIIDLSSAAAACIGLTKKMGITKVEIARIP